MSSRNIDDYLKIARSPTLQRKFPALKKFNRKRTKLTRGEKWQISRAANIAAELKKPREERDKRYVNYRPPGERKKPETLYRKQARALARLDTSRDMAKLAQKKKLMPTEKAKITRAARKVSGFGERLPVTKKQAKKLPKEYVAQYDDIRGVRLANFSSNAKITRVTRKAMYVKDGQFKYKFIPVGDIRDADKYMEAALEAKRKGAKTIGFWTAKGQAGARYQRIEMRDADDDNSFQYALENQFMIYAEKARAENLSDNWIIGIVARY